LAVEYRNWMQDHWNHASVCAWDAQNETWTPATGEAIEMVRHLDLSDRPWDNGWSPPVGKTDYREAHNYLARYNVGSEEGASWEERPEPFKLDDLQENDPYGFTFYAPYQAHYLNGQYNDYWEYPCVLNEYGYLWLNRDGSPTTLTQPYYMEVLGADALPDQRFYHYATKLAALTEYWRARRTFFGILHVFGLSFSSDYAATGDMFTNVDSLTLYPHFGTFVRDSFAPVGICIDFWDTEMKKHQGNWPPLQGFDVPVMVTNDLPVDVNGNFHIQFTQSKTGKVVYEHDYAITVCAFQQTNRHTKITLPKDTGQYFLTAELTVEEQAPVKSTRIIKVVE